jgi:hypothetical protein
MGAVYASSAQLYSPGCTQSITIIFNLTLLTLITLSFFIKCYLFKILNQFDLQRTILLTYHTRIATVTHNKYFLSYFISIMIFLFNLLFYFDVSNKSSNIAPGFPHLIRTYGTLCKKSTCYLWATFCTTCARNLHTDYIPTSYPAIQFQLFHFSYSISDIIIQVILIVYFHIHIQIRLEFDADKEISGNFLAGISLIIQVLGYSRR